jgi:Uma2 family endonuclease
MGCENCDNEAEESRPMSTLTHRTVADFLRRNEKPEAELIGGELVPKPMGTLDHMRMEQRLHRLLLPFAERGLGQVVWELSFRHGDEVRIPDVVFLSSSAGFEDGILVDAPTLCVEILSPSQRLSELVAKCDVYHAWGVPYCWVVDPIGKKAWEYPNREPISLVPEGGVLKAGDLAVGGSELFLN